MTQPFRKHSDLLPDMFTHLGGLLDYTFAEDLTGWEAPETWITIQPSGGGIGKVRLATPRFDVNVYGPTKPEAFGISMDVIQALMQMKNFVGDGFVITDVICSYPADISDPLNYNPRWVFDLTITYRTN